MICKRSLLYFKEHLAENYIDAFACYTFLLMLFKHHNAITLTFISREENRIKKWRKMIGVGGSDWKHYVRRKPHVVKRRIRKGIPDCLRGLVWQLISGSRDLLLMNPGVYEVKLCDLLYQLYMEFLREYKVKNPKDVM